MFRGITCMREPIQSGIVSAYGTQMYKGQTKPRHPFPNSLELGQSAPAGAEWPKRN